MLQITQLKRVSIMRLKYFVCLWHQWFTVLEIFINYFCSSILRLHLQEISKCTVKFFARCLKKNHAVCRKTLKYLSSISPQQFCCVISRPYWQGIVFINWNCLQIENVSINHDVKFLQKSYTLIKVWFSGVVKSKWQLTACFVLALKLLEMRKLK